VWLLREKEKDMMYRGLALVVVMLLLVGTSVPAQEAAKDATADKNTHTGQVISVTANKLVMKGADKVGEEAKEHTHTLAANAKVLCDGKECKLQELRPGQRIRVTTQADNPNIAVRIEALDKNKEFERPDSK
jgi:hypothetical protein